jgi:hypothetical protein
MPCAAPATCVGAARSFVASAELLRQKRRRRDDAAAAHTGTPRATRPRRSCRRLAQRASASRAASHTPRTRADAMPVEHSLAVTLRRARLFCVLGGEQLDVLRRRGELAQQRGARRQLEICKVKARRNRAAHQRVIEFSRRRRLAAMQARGQQAARGGCGANTGDRAPSGGGRDIARETAAEPVPSRHHVLRAQARSAAARRSEQARCMRRACSLWPAAQSWPSVVRRTSPAGDISTTAAERAQHAGESDVAQ